jgi:NADH-quinone oxidoreductase subunit L
MPNQYYLLLIPLMPLAAFLVLGLFGRKYPGAAAGIVGTVVLLAVTILALFAAQDYFFHTGKVNGVYQHIVVFKYTWLQFSPHISIDMGILLDPISVMMIVIVSFISLMVHVFSLGYMKGEERLPTYYAFLSLFTFSMLGLVLSSNIFQLYIFWELVGVSSYLLIGFYFDKPSAVAASKKAFIVTRFADLGFLVGILILAFNAETLDFGILVERLTNAQSSWSIDIASSSFMGISALTWGLVLVFAGGAGKSAMFPLHIWLPDAMEGPTPVSALIHAATMVVAGVYLVARLFRVFSFDEISLHVVAYVGACSALIAALIACTQTDIKRVLAYSTMSQIGYMMFALGVSDYRNGDLFYSSNAGFSASMFHLFTHAFFKSLLFLGAGAIIHMVHSNDMRGMGGLRKSMPVTHGCFLIACLAIAGIPPFSGFFSKEEILTAAFHANKFIYGIGLFVSGLTAFYMFRLYFSVFWNKQSAPVLQNDAHHRQEGTITMKLPLIVLATITVLAGFVPFSKYIFADGTPPETGVDALLSIAPVTLALAGIVLAAVLYRKENEKPARIAASLGGLYRVTYRKFYIDEIYLFITKKIVFNCIGRPAAWIDKNIVDGLVNGTAAATAGLARLIKSIQSGKVQSYALYFFAGIAGLAVMVIYLWKS